MPFRIILILVCVCLSSFKSVETEEEILYWSSTRQLVYTDFKADTTAAAHAAISCLKVIPFLSIDGNVLKYKIIAGFYPGCSYMKYRDKRLLGHEQLHFDMVEVYARKMRQYLHSCAYTGVSADELNNVLTRMDADLQAVQKVYDRVTDHGLKPGAQIHWGKQVSAALDSLSGYSKPEGVITISGKMPR